MPSARDPRVAFGYRVELLDLVGARLPALRDRVGGEQLLSEVERHPRPGAVVVLGQALGHQRPRRFVFGHKTLEGVAIQLERGSAAQRLDRCVLIGAGDQRRLADRVAGAQERDVDVLPVAVLMHAQVPLPDDEHGAREIALAHEELPGRELPRTQLADQLGERGRRKPGEDRVNAQEVP